ncbi:hypothetical protein PPSIR1_40050 [Plesiocystis pacifica SIR-1]|uniref:DUF4013 domain-containing protein n=1 Tax=Plesiocystis pacifica SIR-1 TaxID=391625 RepID=A6FYE0_9BACT|nr:DUF4013 domain-containing protein [Plesiocystis pacifica]EDM81519.1 hypothetical protein PPSIR1_40050 [Plesiocystis pacifica SIR-1]
MSVNPYAAPSPPPTSDDAAAPPEQFTGRLSAWEAMRFGVGEVGMVNLLIALVLMMIPIVGPIALMGWLSDIHRRLARRESPAVERIGFDDPMEPLRAGLVPFVAQMVASMVISLPATALTLAVVFPLAALDDPGAAVLIVFGLAFTLLMVVAFIFGALIMNPVMIIAELTGSFSKTFDLDLVWRMGKATWLPALLASLVFMALAMVLMMLGVVAFFVGIYIAAMMLQFASAHLRWQIYELWLAQGGEALDIEPGKGASL